MTRKKKILLGVAFIATYLIDNYAGSEGKVKFAKVNPTPTPFVVSQEMTGLGQQIGLSNAQLQAVHAQFGTPPAGGCDPNYFASCYVPATTTVYLYLSQYTKLNEHPATALAYEWSHYEWQNLPDAQKKVYEPMLMELYNSLGPAFHTHFAPILSIEGGLGSSAFYDEMHANACTLVSDDKLNPTLLDHCKTYLPNRAALTNQY